MSKELSCEHFFDLRSFQHASLFDECDFVWQALEKLKSYIQKQTLGKIESEHQEYAYLVNPETISIGSGTVIEAGAYIKGPCIIGKNCHIRHGAYLRGDVIIGDRCVVGHSCEIKHAVLLNDVGGLHFAYVGDSIIGNGVNVGAGVKCANLRLNREPIVVHFQEESFSTGLKKFGVIVGDGSQIGCNVVMNPGTILSKKVFVHPGICFGGYVLENHFVKPASSAVIVEHTLAK